MSERSDTPKQSEPSKEDSQAEWDAALDDGLCEVCGGEGWIMACDGDGSDWGEDTYSGPMDAVIECRHCNGGFRR